MSRYHRVVVRYGSLTPVRLMDVPQSVQVVTRELLDEQKVFQYSDALSYLPGVQRAHTNINGSVGNEVSMRGFILNTNNSYLRDGYKFFGVGRSDIADIEEVQVLKGLASALYRAAEPGGVVNLITKKPTSDPFVSLSMTGGSFAFRGPEFDISGPVNGSNTLSTGSIECTRTRTVTGTMFIRRKDSWLPTCCGSPTQPAASLFSLNSSM